MLHSAAAPARQRPGEPRHPPVPEIVIPERLRLTHRSRFNRVLHGRIKSILPIIRKRLQPARDQNLRLQFEAISRFDEGEKEIIRSLLEAAVLKYEARRWSGTGGVRN